MSTSLVDEIVEHQTVVAEKTERQLAVLRELGFRVPSICKCLVVRDLRTEPAKARTELAKAREQHKREPHWDLREVGDAVLLACYAGPVALLVVFPKE